MKDMKKAFTLVEMLVVIGIIAVITAALVGLFGIAQKSAQKARGQEIVSNVATSLSAMFQETGRWPGCILEGNGNDEYRLGPKPGAALARKGGFSLTYTKSADGGYTLTGHDRFGILDPWAADVVKRARGDGSVSPSTKVPQGGTINDHVIRYAVDTEGLGFVKAQVCGEAIQVRANAIAWSCGPDGKFQSLKEMGRSDDIFSFTMGQIKK